MVFIMTFAIREKEKKIREMAGGREKNLQSYAENGWILRHIHTCVGAIGSCGHDTIQSFARMAEQQKS
jgi:hypothetical protein